MSIPINNRSGEIVSQSKVEAFEDALATLPPVDLPHSNHFSQGLYCREMPIPAGVALTGKVHKQDHLAMLIKGTIKITTGGDSETLTAPAIVPSKAGVKRAIFAVTDAIFITVHATELTDVDEIETAMVEEPRPHITEARKRLS